MDGWMAADLCNCNCGDLLELSALLILQMDLADIDDGSIFVLLSMWNNCPLEKKLMAIVAVHCLMC